ncbi:MAG: ArnT family glycosyltransferase [Parvularcula sp.]
MINGYRQPPSGAHIIVIAAFALVVGFSGLLTVPPLDRDESRFIQATTQMIETGDYIRIRYQDEERNKKPVGIYWLQAASVQTLADVEDRPLWAYRLPSLLGAALAAIFTYHVGTTLFGRSAGFLAAMLLAAAPVVAGEASIAKTDAVLLACVCGMQAALARLLLSGRERPSAGSVYGFWIALGAGILVKGPIAPMIALFTVLTAWLVARAQGQPLGLAARLKPVRGLLIVSIMVLPWAIAIGIVTDGRFYVDAVGTDMLGKIGQGQEKHSGPPGYHLIALWLMFWPAALFIPAAVRHAVPKWKDGAIAFCLGWLVPSWIVFELASTKLAHYTMVLYPAIALLVGHLIVSVPSDQYRLLRWLGAALFGLVGLIAAAAVPLLAHTYATDGINGWHYVGSALIIVGTAMAVWAIIRRKTLRAFTLAILVSGSFAWIAFEGVLPTLDRLALTPRLASMLDRNEAHPLRDDTPPVALVGYHEPSAVFMLGTQTKLLTPEQAAVWIIAGEGRSVVVEARTFEEFMAALPPGTAVEAIESIEGFNYSNNRDMRLTLYRLR